MRVEGGGGGFWGGCGPIRIKICSTVPGAHMGSIYRQFRGHLLLHVTDPGSWS